MKSEAQLLAEMDRCTEALIATPLEDTLDRIILLALRDELAEQLDEFDREAGRESAHECYADQR